MTENLDIEGFCFIYLFFTVLLALKQIWYTEFTKLVKKKQLYCYNVFMVWM